MHPTHYSSRELSTDMAISIAVAMVQSRLDYCNSLLYGISAFNINKLQRVQNLAAKIALNDWHSPSQELLSAQPTPLASSGACHDGAEVSASGLKIVRSPVRISPKTNFSMLIKLPVKSTGK